MKHQSFFKPWLLLAAALMATMPLMAQMVSNYNVDEVYKIDPSARMAYRPGEIIVKFKASSPVNIKSVNGKFSTSRVNAVDAVLNSLGVKEAEQLMPLTGAVKGQPRRMKAYNGNNVVESDLSKLYCLKFDETKAQSIYDAVEQLKAIPEVEFAEPNYLQFIQSVEEAEQYAQEPYYPEQYGIGAINLPQLWAVDKITTKRPVIAIIDTGVDIEHPDLVDNIWTNPLEATGAENADNDNNGFKNDVHGWDFVNNSARMRDNNGHGTHCAGIAAAVGNNGIGITGANPDAYIMPVTVMQSDGVGDIATIIKGIDYAAANGADVISMSIGGSAYSVAYEQALAKAYMTAVIVAAAGNDGNCIYYHDQPCYHPTTGAPNYGYTCFPAGFTFVLGVLATDSNSTLAGFSNYDHDGPIYSAFNEEQLYNYELAAPGSSILSTYPNGRYQSMSGTSMATPLVAGAISRLLQCKEISNKEELFGDLIHTRSGYYSNIDIFGAYSINDGDRHPTLQFVTYTIDDSEGDADSRPDAGETIDIYPTLRNDWGNAMNIHISIALAENEDPEIVEFITQEADFGYNLSSYGKAKAANPLRLKIADSAADMRHISMVLTATCDNADEFFTQDITLQVDNGEEIGGTIIEDMTLYPNKHYIVTKSIGIPLGKTLKILPGTRLEFNSNCYIQSEGKLIANGTSDQPIVFTRRAGQGLWNGIRSINKCDTVSYCLLDFFKYNMYSSSNSYEINMYYKDCVLQMGTSNNYMLFSYVYSKFEGMRNMFINTDVGTRLNQIDSHFQFNNFVNCYTKYNREDYNWTYQGLFSSNVIHSGYYDSSTNELYLVGRDNGVKIDHSDNPSWLGSSNKELLRYYIYDSNNPSVDCLTTVDLSNMPTRPIHETHGIVWKVVVDGYDAQDEFDMLPPLGVGKHKFEVYFNRDDMDTTATPTIAMGVRPPYTSIPIAEDGFWSVKDSVDVYTAYLTITGKTNADGLNRIYVTGAKDYDHFDVPDEYWRFNVLVQAAGSLATGFAAEPGLGKIDLIWNNENNDMEDAMGYNVYRYQMVNDSTAGDTIRINEVMLDVDAETFTDYDVIPGETYYYYYKVMSTDLKEYDISNVVAATPLTSIKGDANGSMHVDVADIVSIVAYLSQQQPQPFIYEAADVNEDGNINILDIVGVINIIAHPEVNAAPSIMSGAVYTIEDGILYVNSPVALGGVQVMVNAPEGTEVKTLEALDAMERMWIQMDENTRLLLAYSMTGKTIPAGKTALLELGNVPVTDIVLSDAMGNNIMVEQGDVTTVTEVRAEVKPVATGIYDLMGRKIASDVRQLKHLQPGIYIVNGVKTAKF